MRLPTCWGWKSCCYTTTRQRRRRRQRPEPTALCESNESSSDEEIDDLVVLPTTTSDYFILNHYCATRDSTSSCQRSGTPERDSRRWCTTAEIYHYRNPKRAPSSWPWSARSCQCWGINPPWKPQTTTEPATTRSPGETNVTRLYNATTTTPTNVWQTHPSSRKHTLPLLQNTWPILSTFFSLPFTQWYTSLSPPTIHVKLYILNFYWRLKHSFSKLL